MKLADPTGPFGTSATSLWTRPQRYGFAIVLVVLATIVRFALEVALGPFPPFVMFFPAVILAAVVGGFGPGILATVLSSTSVALFFWNSMKSFEPDPAREEVGLVLFSVLGAGLCGLAAIYRRRAGSLRLFRSLIDQSNDAVEVLDPETLRVLDVNETACKQLGYTRHELLAMTMYEFDPSLTEQERTRVVKRLRDGECEPTETIHKRKDQSTFPVETSLTLVKLEKQYLIAVSRDISRRRKAARALRESEDRFRDLVEHSEDLVCTHDLQGKLMSVNPAPARILGYTVDELLQISMRDLVAPDFRERFDSYLSRIKATGVDSGLLCVITRSGERRIWEYRNTLRTEGVSEPIVRGMAHDVTERTRAEACLRSSEERYRTLFERSVAGVAISSLDGEILDCNEAWARMLGYDSPSEIRGRHAREFYFDVSERESARSELLRSGFLASREIQLRRKDGTPVWILYSSTVRPENRGGPPVLQATVIDITARKQAEEALRRREEDYRQFVAQSSEGIFRLDLDAPLPLDLPEDELIHHILYDSSLAECNDALARMYGRHSSEQMVGKRMVEMVLSDDPRNIELTREFIRSGFGLLDRELREVDAHGNPKIFRNSMVGIVEDGKLVRTWGIQRDVTEQRKAEEAIRASEERFRIALKDSPTTVFCQDCDLRYTWLYNPQLYRDEDVLGKTDEELFGKKKGAMLTDLKHRVLKTEKPAREEVVLSHNGAYLAFDVSVEPRFDAGGALIGIRGTSTNIARLRELADRLQEARDRLTQEKSYLESEIQSELGFEKIVGQSSALREVLGKARVVAPTDSTVLLLGETGTGKELVARSLHSLSCRNDKNFVKLNCAAVPSGLLESELFGHEKGAFTGAVSQKVGRMELADGGTLFLDEVGELPQELQPKLLRVLQDREFERLGGVHTLRVDVRIIAATNRDLRQDVANKKFREDLYYRLNVFPVELPPLRQRREDIPMLVQYFMGKHARKMGKHIDTVPLETMRTLEKWNWPGNIRELENMIERMVILSKGHVLADPPAELHESEDFFDNNLTEVERAHIIRVLRETNGVVSGVDGAASRLGVKRTTLQSMLKRFGIEAQEYRRAAGAFARE